MANFLKLPTRSQGLYRVVIETPRGSAAKLAYEPSTGVFEYSRPLPVGNTYPYDWGFIPSTLGDDGDPLDGLVIHQATTAPGVVIKCDLLGSLRIKQKDPHGAEIRNDRYIFARTRRILRMSRSLPTTFRRICGRRSSSSSSHRYLAPARN